MRRAARAASPFSGAGAPAPSAGALLVCVLLAAFPALGGPKKAAAPARDAASVCVERAREAAAADRHRSAIDLYLGACALDSSLADELGKEIGLQYTWDDQPALSLAWFRRYLSRSPDDDEAALGYARALSWSDSLEASRHVYRLVEERSPGNLDAPLGEAQVVAWMGRSGEAESLYRDILSREPGSVEAQLGLAQVVNWRGRHREARRLYANVLRDHPDERRAAIGLAAAEHWLGRDDNARRLLIGHTAEGEARAMIAEIDRSQAPTARVDYGISRDSDELVMHRLETSATVFPGDMTSVGMSAARVSMRQDSRPRVVAYSIAAHLSHRFSEAWAVNLGAGPLWSSYETETSDETLGLPAGEHSFNTFVVNGWLTWTPHDRLRVDLSEDRMTVETPLSYIKEIALDAVGAGADVKMSERVTLRGGYDLRSYSDGNTRDAWRSEVALLVLRKPFEATVTPGYNGFSFSESRPNGYYNPSHYDNLGITGDVKVSLPGPVRLALGGRVSAERESWGDYFTVGTLDVSLEVDGGSRATAGAEFFTSNSRIAGAAGYSRTLGAVFISVRF